MLRHQKNEHGADREPDFTIRAVKYHKTVLFKQIGEAVRIRRRGGKGASSTVNLSLIDFTFPAWWWRRKMWRRWSRRSYTENYKCWSLWKKRTRTGTRRN